MTSLEIEARDGQGAHLPGEQPMRWIHGGPGGVSRNALRELAAFRGVLSAFALRQVKVKYKQAAVGVGWAVLQPLLAAGIRPVPRSLRRRAQ